MKFLRHPIHVMLIHFPAALFPMELVCYFLFYNSGDVSYANASLYAMVGGSALGVLAIITGAIDLIMIDDDGTAQAKALIHGFINSVIVIGYCIIAYEAYKHYPDTPVASVTMLVLKAVLNLLMIAGNYLGGNLVLRYKVGTISEQ